jgi:hypothetical protein
VFWAHESGMKRNVAGIDSATNALVRAKAKAGSIEAN